jgi:aspartyl/asparaginyl-tRNA synthetase
MKKEKILKKATETHSRGGTGSVLRLSLLCDPEKEEAKKQKKQTMFNQRTKIKELLQKGQAGETVTVMGWVRTFRNNQFIALNDGSTNQNIQVVASLGDFSDDLLRRLTTGASLKITGELVASVGKGQSIEIKAATIEVLGDSDAEKYPLQPKKHSLEFLREIAHLRFRTNTFGSVFRVRHALHLIFVLSIQRVVLSILE